MAIAERKNIEFGVEGGVRLRGWLFVPGAKGPAPAITMAHGYAGVKEHGLERFARVFAEAGFVVLVFTIRTTRAARMYEPGIWVSRVSPTPLLMVVALSDTMTVTDLALAAYQRALEPKRLQLISGGHFAPYLDQFPLAVAAATEWFSEHLLNPGARRVTQVAIHSASSQANSDIANV